MAGVRTGRRQRRRLRQWCKDHNVEQTEEYAELFVEQTEERLWEEQEGPEV